ncbi:hypothetical protein [uncultured Marivirga sp.]|uniref:DoxX family protein n=1 Tax=uncultured Marivirga sp. TaxID=1123707 RepID=UPI0030EE9634
MLKQIGTYLEMKGSVWLIAGFYLIAGVNHFINPQFYWPLIPPFFENPEEINKISGIAEILLAGGLFFYPSRKTTSFITIIVLLAFVPSHIYFIQIGSCIDNGLCVPEWIGWLRLIVVHPALILWVWRVGKSTVSLY